ncbi:hypothetical protein CU098_010211 [Rhizopus stolonifer]|uniref:DH domain-containing protein n=1 Tax=Rhizopus stolonifer TaxID=4846 RepID=A0A367KHY3_RHIST|nr:hypothetical protein CU098_010211 [Rhizopus stolonifer]
MSDYNSSMIAKKFLDQISQFSLYKYYCDLHAEAWTLFSEYRDRPEWSGFLKDCVMLDSCFIPFTLASNSLSQPKKLQFEDYLIKPVQRICRYHLLVKEIIRYISPQTAEYDLWSAVLNEMQDIVSEIDHLKQQRDMKERTNRFIERLDSDWRISRRHVAQLGNLLIAGAIEVTYSALGQSVSKPRYLGCFVFNTYMIMVRPKKVISYEPKHWFPLHLADFEDLANIEGQREHSFVVKCRKHTFAFSASCSQEKQVWVKKIQEAILYARNESADGALKSHDFIISSLPNISSKQSPQTVRLSRSFSNMLDVSLVSNKNSEESDIMLDAASFLRRSSSTNLELSDQANMKPTLGKKSSQVTLKKRYSADYSTFINRRSQSSFHLKPRNNSEMYIKPESFGNLVTRRRPNSLDLLSSATNNNMIGKMSLQFKNNHQNAFRVTVDHKLRDVCTQEYLSSRAWHIRDRDQVTGDHLADNELLKKRKSTSFIRTSASSFSLIKRATSDTSKTGVAQNSEYEVPSMTSSYTSSIERSASPINQRLEKSQLSNSSNQLLRKVSFNRGESPFSYDSESSFASNLSVKRLERSPSRKQILVEKVLRRITSLHQKSPSPTSFDSSVRSSFGFDDEKEVSIAQDSHPLLIKFKKAVLKATRHEELAHLKVGDRLAEETNSTKKEKQIVAVLGDHHKNRSTGSFSAFAYASTPVPLEEPVKKKKKWKTKLSLIRPASFLRMTANGNHSTTF